MYKHIILRDNSVTKISTSAQMTGLQMAVPLQVRLLHFGGTLILPIHIHIVILCQFSTI